MFQSQKSIMNPMIYQSIKLMELSVMDLREKISEELERNPALEVLEDRSTVSLEEAINPEKEEEYFDGSPDSPFISRGGEAASDARQRFIEGALSKPETLQEHLLWQLQLEPLSTGMRHACELLIRNLNEDGFNKAPVNDLLSGVDSKTVYKAVEVVRRLEPVGTCTGDFSESLQVQAALLPGAPKGIIKALSYLELLEKGKIAEVAKKMGSTEDDVEEMFERIKELSPFPGRSFSSGDTRYVIPDLQVIKKEGEFIIILNEEEIPVLGINHFFMKLAAGNISDRRVSERRVTSRITVSARERRKFSRPVRDFAQQNINEARWFINSINQRNHTLLKVARAVVEFQRSFFDSGPKYLAPLTLSDIARELAMHETTVSRTANGKYLQTEWGIFELRHFFSNSITGTGSGGSGFSKEGVKQTIKEIIESEDKSLSDKDITELLAKQGITLARRTVAKYRNELDLDTSYNR